MRHLASKSSIVTVVLLLASLAGAAEKKGRKVDLIVTAPDFATFRVGSIAMLPVATYDNNLEARRLTEGAVGQALRGTGYRWLSAASARDMLMRSGGDSLVKAVTAALVKDPRVDSLQAPALCRALRTRALLAFRVENWQRLEMEFNQAGKPSTTVQLRAALVDSTGRLLWSASGSETLEGPYYDPATNTVGVKQSGLSNTPMTGQAGAPAFAEVLTKLLTRWAEQFPAKSAEPAPDSTTAPGQ